MKHLTAEETRSLVALRRRLHREPELSGKEYGTPLILSEFLRDSRPDEVHPSLGGTGLALVYNGTEPGPTLMLRADIDALPIVEENDFAHRSIHEAISHKCGHDGHTAMVAGAGLKMKQYKPAKGRLVLLFQPAEETGKGAEQVIADERYASLKPDYIFGIHNLPKYTNHTAFTRASHFASASCGITIDYKGKTAHAGTPHTGKSPALAVSELIVALNALPKGFSLEIRPLCTVVHARLGEKAFGVAPGNSTVSATIRSITSEGMENLVQAAERIGRSIGEKYGLRVRVSLSEKFPATTNNEEATTILEDAVAAAGFSSQRLEEAFPWSEDFGHYLKDSKGSFFGLGAGNDVPDLHAENYDFPDELIPTGVRIYLSLIEKVLGGLNHH
ncbi:amidohydrolase [Roseivirga sp. BDSF3-8]|uniref:amidohydrolase n=1 Tax=Roseivirga sp. BDSF3-8 TaxID=3241598 RepID=UPI003531C479